MADNNFRPFRSRDSLTREDVDPTSDAARDPLAELARIIGQSNRVNQFDRAPRHDPRHDPSHDPSHEAVQTLDEPLPAPADRDWVADDGYAEPDVPEQYPDQYAEENYVQPRLPDPYPSERAPERYDRDDARVPSIAQYSEPAQHYDDPHDDESGYDARYQDPPRAAGRQPALAPHSNNDEYEAEDQWDDRADSDDAEDYDDEAPARPRRSGLVVVLAMAGLVMIGAGGAFAYRAMFGGAILAPTLPPVIKANDAPTKIVPNRNDSQTAASNPSGATTSGAPDKLVSREEQPVAIQPANAPPRVVSTIPVLPAPGAAPAGPPTVAPSLPAAPAAPSAPPKVAGPGQPPPTATAGSPEPKKVHTVTIRGDQMGNANAAAPATPPAAPTPAARPKATEAPVSRQSPAPKAGGNAPLAIVPVAQGAAPAAEPPPRSHVARNEAPSAPVATAPAPSAGGYAVQVTSQRSEAEAQTEFKTLQAKFPSQLGNRQPLIHRADLGDKGTFYRALVGPFASSEAAAAMCSNLKAAGGSCIVQKN